MGYYDAYYHAATGKIYATMENYVVKCNATTGVRESSLMVCAPMFGPMRITGDSTMLYVSSYLDYSLNRDSVLPYPTSNKQIWNVDPSTLAASNVLMVDDRVQADMAGTLDNDYPHYGPTVMKVLNGYMYFVYITASGGWAMWRVSITNPAGDYEIDNGFSPSRQYQFPEQFDMATIGGTDYLWIPDAYGNSVWSGHVDPLGAFSVFTKDHGPALGANKTTACAYVPSKDRVYFVCGSDILIRYDYTLNVVDPLDLGTVITGGKPARIRLSPLDGKLYIPCQIEDTIIVWDTATESGIAKTGFDSPIDVVFTASKAFAVQSGITPLKEIT